MPTPTTKGQYRKVRYTDDGCTVYQCLWCLGTVEIRDNPHYGWNFCPKCGKSWFNRLECREHGIPRWYYDRWGNPDDNPESPNLWELYNRPPESTSRWVIECRTKWPGDDWGEWTHEFSTDKDPCKPDWQWARSTLAYHRDRHDNDGSGFCEFQYRARLVKKSI